jgi:hypothetical protein
MKVLRKSDGALSMFFFLIYINLRGVVDVQKGNTHVEVQEILVVNSGITFLV